MLKNTETYWPHSEDEGKGVPKGCWVAMAIAVLLIAIPAVWGFCQSVQLGQIESYMQQHVDKVICDRMTPQQAGEYFKREHFTYYLDSNYRTNLRTGVTAYVPVMTVVANSEPSGPFGPITVTYKIYFHEETGKAIDYDILYIGMTMP